MNKYHTDGLSHGDGAIHLVRYPHTWAVYCERRIRHGVAIGSYRTKRQALAAIKALDVTEALSWAA